MKEWRVLPSLLFAALLLGAPACARPRGGNPASPGSGPPAALLPETPVLDPSANAGLIDRPLEELQKLPKDRQSQVVEMAIRMARSSITPEKSVERMKKVLALSPDAYAARLRLAEAYTQLNQTDLAYAEVERVLKHSDIPLGLYTECVGILEDLGKLAEAEEKAKPLTEWKPPYVEGMYLYARILRKEGKTREAEAAYRRIIDIKSDTGGPEVRNPAGAKFFLGEILLEEKRYDEAEKLLLEAADTFHDAAQPFEDLTRLYVAKGDRRNATRFLAKFKEKGGDPKVYAELQKKIS